MDEELTLHEIRRLEAERKLQLIPETVLATAWVREAQVEAVIDAVLAVALGGDAGRLAHARHVGEWCARIAAALGNGPEPAFVRRAGVLAGVDPDAIERITELKHLAPYVREYQSFVLDRVPNPRSITLVLSAAAQFDERLAPDAEGRCPSASSVMRAMQREAGDATRPIVEALAIALRPARSARVVA